MMWRNQEIVVNGSRKNKFTEVRAKLFLREPKGLQVVTPPFNQHHGFSATA